MSRKPVRRYRPDASQALEGRALLSTLATAPARNLPVVKAETLDRVRADIDQSFFDFEGRQKKAGQGLLSFSASTLTPSGSTTTTGTSSAVGNVPALADNVTIAVSRLPFGPTRLVPALRAEISQLSLNMTAQNAEFTRQQVKTLVRRYVIDGLQTGQFALDTGKGVVTNTVPSGPHRAFPAGSTRA